MDERVLENENTGLGAQAAETGVTTEGNTLGRAKKKDKDDGKKHLIKNRVLREILSYAFYIGLATAIALLWRTFVLTKVEVVSGSMENTLKKDDRLVVSKLPYIFGDVKRGDIIVFKYPDDESQTFIKRVIGLPGEVVDIVEGKVYIDGTLLAEDYLGSNKRESYGPYKVPEGCYFVLGDNRANSMDARFWSNKYVMEEKIVGKALFRYKPKIEKIYTD